MTEYYMYSVATYLHMATGHVQVRCNPVYVIFCTKKIKQAEVMSKLDVGIMRPAQVTLAAAI